MRSVILLLALIIASPASALGQVPQAVTLDAAMASAVERHPSVVAAARSLEAAQARLVQARAGSSVQVSVTGRASVGTLGPTGTPTGGGVAAAHSVGLDASLPLYDGGITAQQVVQAEAAVDSAQASLAAARQDVALNAAVAYFNVLRAQRTVEVREAALRAAQGHVQQAEAFVRAGTGARADVIKAQASAATAEADLIAGRGQVETALVSLRSAMALPLTQAISVADPAEPVPVSVAPADAAAQAAQARPEVLRLLAEIRSAEAAVRIAEIRAGVLVTVSANGAVQVTPNPGDAGWSISATLSRPVIDGGAAKAEVAEARANLQAAAARRDATVLQVQTQAYQAAAGVRDTAARSQALRVSVSASEESLRVAEGRYRAGVGTLLEVLDAQTATTTATITSLQTVYDLHQALVNLQYSTGQPLVRRT